MSYGNIDIPTGNIVFDPALDPNKSMMDYSSDAYLQRGNVLDENVRYLVREIEQSNAYLEEINKLMAEANRVIYNSDNYVATTWQTDFAPATNPKTVVLSNGYNLAIDGNNQFSLKDKDGNTLTYQAGNLQRIPAGETASVGDISVSTSGNTTLVLDDSTKITLIPNGNNGISSLVITRGNQALTINGIDGAPSTAGPVLNGNADSNHNDGDVYLENTGVHELWLGVGNENNYGTGNGILTAEQEAFIRGQLNIDIDLPEPMTTQAWNTLKSELTLVRDNLTGSNQLQTVLLQSALTTYNQNYDAMSNTQNKIYTLLKDIIGKV
ncbi:hypothetical protein [Candidatus Sororendozoicomonas aggregata]|uniref:hypothetical protein n=1 Tax=Candidatus Sororendozoicomonas aggregata TaxID=3073239 RepID=UPI002ED334FF